MKEERFCKCGEVAILGRDGEVFCEDCGRYNITDLEIDKLGFVRLEE
jgi:hypothetical protein